MLAQNSEAANSATAPQSADTQIALLIKSLLQQSFDEINVRGNFVKAAEVAQQARGLSQKAGDKRSEAEAMVYLAAALSYQGRVNEALDIAQQTLVAARQSGDKKQIEQALNNLGSITGGLGRYEESVGYFYDLSNLAREVKDPVMEYMSLLNLGEAYTRSGEPDRAEDPLLNALKLAGELDHGDAKSKARAKKGIEMALLNLAGMEMARNHYGTALRYFRRVHDGQPSTPLWAIAALQGMANANQFLGNPREAISLFEQAFALAEKSPGGDYQRATITSNLGLSQEATGDLDAALTSQTRALSIFHSAGGDPEDEWQIESHMGHVLRTMGRKEEALLHYQESIRDLERLRLQAINTEEGHAQAVGKSHATYAETADLLVDLRRESDAFAIAERGRARAFLDMLAVTRGGLPEELSGEQRTREQALLARTSSAQKELWKPALTAKDEQQWKKELKSAEEDLDAFEIEVRHSNPRYASLRYPDPRDALRVQRELLDDHTSLVEFLLGENRSLVWVISKDKLTVAILPPRVEIDKQLAEYRKLLSDKPSVLTLRTSIEKIDRLGSALYLALLRPVRDAIPVRDKLIIVPDGALDYLPFETLVTGMRRDASGQSRPIYVLERFSISYAPSASALLAVRDMNPQGSQWSKSLLAFGDPVLRLQTEKPGLRGQIVRAADDSGDTATSAQVPSACGGYQERGFSLARLPFTREEVLSIGRLFPESQRQIYLAKAATEDAVMAENLAQYRYIHFATHGFLDESATGRSGILFSSDPRSQEAGVLQSGQIMRLKMHADLVTLSACSTGLGKMVNGEGILGLTRAFFYAGAHNIAVSLWNVNDSATSALMRSFYARLRTGATKSEALRRAKLQLLHGSNPIWRSPYFWAPFIMAGEGK